MGFPAPDADSEGLTGKGLAGRDDPEGDAGTVVPGQHSRRAQHPGRGSFAAVDFDAKGRCDGLCGDHSRSEDAGGMACQVEYRGFDPDLAGPAVEDGVDAITELICHGVGGGGGEPVAAVGAGGGEWDPRGAQEGEGDGMARHAKRDRVATGNDRGGDACSKGEDEGQRPGPEGGGETGGAFVPAGGPAGGVFCVCAMNDQGIVGGAPLCLEDFLHGVFMAGVGAQPVDRFRGKGDEPPGAQDHRRARERALGILLRPRGEELRHGTAVTVHRFFLVSPGVFASGSGNSCATQARPQQRTEPMHETYKNRHQSLRKLLRKEGLDAIIVHSRPNTFYLSGFRSSYSLLVIDGREATMITDGRYAEAAEKALPGFRMVIQPMQKVKEFLADFFRGKGYGKLAFEGTITVAEHELLKKWTRGTRLVRNDGLIATLRRVKDAEEIAAITAAVRLGDRLMEAAIGQLRPGVPEGEISRFIRRTAEDLGADGESFSNIVASGPNSSRPHHHPGPRKLRAGDPVTIDLGVVHRGYCSDLTRTPVLGKVDRKFAEIYEVCLAANLAAVEQLRPGMTGPEVDRLARDVVEAAGFAEYFNHGTGHGVGVEIHEGPRLSPLGGDYKLEPGNIVTIEPGIYLPGKFGVRIEDYVLVTATGAKVLSRAPRELRILPI